jgi:hypothetical protein
VPDDSQPGGTAVSAFVPSGIGWPGDPADADTPSRRVIVCLGGFAWIALNLILLK